MEDNVTEQIEAVQSTVKQLIDKMKNSGLNLDSLIHNLEQQNELLEQKKRQHEQ